MKTPTKFKINADIEASMERDGANYTGNLIVMSENLDDYDIYQLRDGYWELEFDSLTNKSCELELPEAAIKNSEGWTGWLWDEVPGFAAWAEEMKALVPANEITQNQKPNKNMNTPEKLTLHYERPIDGKSPFKYIAYEGENEVETGFFKQATSDLDTWKAFSYSFEEIISFRSLAAKTEPYKEK